MDLNKISKFNTAPLLLLLAERKSPNEFLDLDSAIFGRWEALKNTENLSVSARKEKEMLNQVIEWLSIANEFQKQKESER